MGTISFVAAPQKLTYAPTPPSDRAKVVREGDGFVLTIPPKLSWRFAIAAALGIGAGIALLGGAVWPGSGLPAMVRLIYSACGVYVCYAMIDQFSSRRDWAVITLVNGRIRVKTPHLFRHRERDFALADYSDASMAARESRGYLTLIRKTGEEEVLFEDRLYRPADLRFAESILRDAIKRLDPEYTRQQESLEASLAALRLALPENSSDNRLA